MMKKPFHLVVLCAAGALGILLLPNALNLSLARGQSPQQERASLSARATSNEPRTTTHIERAPVRVLQDPKSSFSAVAVDVARDEIVLQDENQEQIVVFNRLDNTPPQAAMTEPKRTIGGSRTNISMNCGIYVDPGSGDIYSVNGDVTNWLSVFSREAKGNVAADRSLHTPHRTFGIAVDEEAQELFLTINHAPAVVVYRKMASGEEPPLRILEGDQTQLGDVQGIAVDTKNQLMYVANRGARSRNKNNLGWTRALKEGGRQWEIPQQKDAWRNFIPGSGAFSLPSITVYPLKASGDTAPVRVIQGPRTRLNWPAHVSLDVEHGELFVANTVADEILVFAANANGDVAPLRILKGPRTGIKHPHGVYLDTKNDELVVANFGNHAATVYRRTASGDTPPIRTIRAAPPNTPATMLGNVGALAYDTRREQILAPN
ncbi:MAG: beta-propeller fold lactonase family protein [Acidobacteria bacterium]|nr:beta-propeller fold lactonase family protein [Acidobacteriota bacterium]